MKKEDLFLIDRTIFTNKKDSIEQERNEFYKRCIWNDSFPEFCKKASDYLKESNDSEEFIDKILEDESMLDLNEQAYSELSKHCRPKKHKYKILRQMLDAGDMFTTSCDGGSVKISNENFSILIPNGDGDGKAKVGIFNKKGEKFYSGMMEFFTIVEGKFFIQDYDCSDDISSSIRELDGKYSIYVYNGFVAFVEE